MNELQECRWLFNLKTNSFGKQINLNKKFGNIFRAVAWPLAMRFSMLRCIVDAIGIFPFPNKINWSAAPIWWNDAVPLPSSSLRFVLRAIVCFKFIANECYFGKFNFVAFLCSPTINITLCSALYPIARRTVAVLLLLSRFFQIHNC